MADSALGEAFASAQGTHFVRKGVFNVLPHVAQHLARSVRLHHAQTRPSRSPSSATRSSRRFGLPRVSLLLPHGISEASVSDKSAAIAVIDPQRKHTMPTQEGEMNCNTPAPP